MEASTARGEGVAEEEGPWGGGTKERRSRGPGRHLVASPFPQGGRGPRLGAEGRWAHGTGSRRGWVPKGVLPSKPTPEPLPIPQALPDPRSGRLSEVGI